MGARLVRDHIGRHVPEIRAQLRPVRGPEEHRELLHRKLLGEVGELIYAPPHELVEELADVLEVLNAIATLAGIKGAEVNRAAIKKRSDRGGFTGGIVWDTTVRNAA